MAESFSTVTKNKFVSAFTSTSLIILKAISEYRTSLDKDVLSKEFAAATQLMNNLAKSISAIIAESFTEGAFMDPYIFCDNDVSERMQLTLKTIIRKMIEVMKQMNAITEGGYDEEKAERIKSTLGELFLIIRYDIISMPEGEVDDIADIGTVYGQLDRINLHNNDHFVVKNLWQNSSRKILPSYDAGDVAIVMQGPIDYERDFTLETLMRYRRLYPNTLIILSTWKGEINDDFREVISAIGITIVENDMPSDRGPSNIACQVASSLGGISRAEKETGVRYVLKTRTDQAFYLPDFLLYFRNTLKTYPVRNAGLKERIIFLGTHGSMCTYPFRITDFMAFGTIDDVKNLYMVPDNFDRLQFTQSSEEKKNGQYFYVLKMAIEDSYAKALEMSEEERMQIVKDIGIRQDPESFFIQSLCERVVYKRQFSENDDLLMLYWRFLKDCAVLIDPDELLFYWDKYSSRYVDISSNTSEGGLTHATWTSFYYWDL